MAEKRRFGPHLIDCELGPGQNEHYIRLQLKYHNKNGWRCGESNPVPLACEASALPYELHPLISVYKLHNIIFC